MPDILADSFAYTFFLAAGAVIAGVHAHGMYSARIAKDEVLHFSDLFSSTNLSALGGANAFAKGFLCYLLIVELIYLVLATSTGILEYAMQVAIPENTAGAQSITGSQAAPNPLVPIAAAAFMSTASRIPPFSEIETLFRRIAHYIAGIPHTAYQIVDEINVYEFDQRDDEGAISRTLASARKQAAAVLTAARDSGLGALEAELLTHSVLRIYCIAGWSIGPDAERFWSRRSRDTLRPQFETLMSRFDSFDTKLQKLLRGAEAENGKRNDLPEWEQLPTVAQNLKDDFLAICALLLINNPEFNPPDRDPSIKRLIAHVNNREPQPEFNAVVGAMVLSLFAASAIIFVCSLAGRLVSDAKGSLATLPGELFRLVTTQIHLGGIMDKAMWDAANYTLILGGAALIALSLRASRIANGRWRKWQSGSNNYPFIQYTQIALLATVCILPFYVLLNFVFQVILPAMGSAFMETFQSLWSDFATTIPGFLTRAFMGAASAWVACLVADVGQGITRRELSRVLLLAALLCSLIHVASARVDLNFGALESISGGDSFFRYFVTGLIEFAIPALLVSGFLFLYSANYLWLAKLAGRDMRLLEAWLLAALIGMSGIAHAADAGANRDAIEIRVGIRNNVRPFSYWDESRTIDRLAIENYQGFMVRVCQRVLQEMITEGPYRGAKIKVVQIPAKGRFDQLKRGEVDLLCGPDSITDDRLKEFNASYPMYLSGITYAYNRKFPPRDYCGNVLGGVAETTAIEEGLRVLGEKGSLMRFDQELKDHLAGAVTRAAVEQHRYQTKNCPTGYTAMPITTYPDHESGLDAFCKGEVLYYIGDIDIIKFQVQDWDRKMRGKMHCDVKVEQYTLSREVYGLFFRKGYGSAGDTHGGGRDGFDDALFFSVFNNALLRMMQGDNNVLEQSFAREFAGYRMSPDLAEFFRSMKITNGWKH